MSKIKELYDYVVAARRLKERQMLTLRSEIREMEMRWEFLKGQEWSYRHMAEMFEVVFPDLMEKEEGS